MSVNHRAAQDRMFQPKPILTPSSLNLRGADDRTSVDPEGNFSCGIGVHTDDGVAPASARGARE